MGYPTVYPIKYTYGCVVLCFILVMYRKYNIYSIIYISNIRRTLVGNKIVDHSDVVGASPAGAAPTTSSFST